MSALNTNKSLARLCWLIFAAVSGPALAQSSPVNGEFDNDLSGWTFNDPPTPTWSSMDYQNDPASGSVELTNDAAEASVRVYPLTQCFPVPPGVYVIEAYGRLQASQPSARLVISYAYFSNSECTGGYHRAGGFYLDSVGAWGGIPYYYPLILMDLGMPGYMGFLLGIEKTAAGGVAVGNFDGVRLISIEQIFADGFEGKQTSP